MMAVRATSGAVSQRSMRGPMEQAGMPALTARSASNGSNPPSGPVMTAALLNSPEMALRSAVRSPVSYIKSGRSDLRAASIAAVKSGRISTSGITPRPDCFAASSAMRCQR